MISKLESDKKVREVLAPSALGRITKPLSHIVDRLEREFMPLAKEKKIQFKIFKNYQYDPASFIESDVYNILWNVLENSLRFTEPGGGIFLDVVTDHHNAKIKLSDSGIGIEQKELSSLFTKFHRGTSTLNYNHEGTGLGLYMCKLLTERNGGVISVSSIEGSGTAVLVTLPILDPKELKTNKKYRESI